MEEFYKYKTFKEAILNKEPGKIDTTTKNFNSSLEKYILHYMRTNQDEKDLQLFSFYVQTFLNAAFTTILNKYGLLDNITQIKNQIEYKQLLKKNINICWLSRNRGSIVIDKKATIIDFQNIDYISELFNCKKNSIEYTLLKFYASTKTNQKLLKTAYLYLQIN